METLWLFRSKLGISTISRNTSSGRFILAINEDVVGEYPTPEEAAIALSTRSTDDAEYNARLGDDDVPKRFSDWEAASEDE